MITRFRFHVEINNYKEMILKLRNPTRVLVAASALASVFALTSCQKADNASGSNDGDTVKIGFITDMSGVYADVDGPAGAEAIKMQLRILVTRSMARKSNLFRQTIRIKLISQPARRVSGSISRVWIC